MPRPASPQARSRKGWLGPMVSSRSCGPEPCTSTTQGTRRPSSTARRGRVNVAGRRKPSHTTTVSRSSIFRLSKTAGFCTAGFGAGFTKRPAMRPSPSKAVWKRRVYFSKARSQKQTANPSASTWCQSPVDCKGPNCITNCWYIPPNASAGKAACISSLSIARRRLSPCPATK